MFTLGVVVITALANVAVAVLLLRRNPHSVTNRLIAALSIVTALWTVFNYLALEPGTEATRLFWVRTVMFVTAPYGTIILLLADAFPDTHLHYSKKAAPWLFTYNFITAILAHSPYMFTGLINQPDGGFSLYPGWAVSIYGVGFMGFMTWGFIKLVRKLKEAKGLLHTQLRLFLIGLIISFSLLTATNFVAVLIFHSIQLTYLGPPFTLILFAFLLYAIIKHRFLDVTAVVARAVTFVLILATLVGLEAGIVFLGAKLLPVTIDRVVIAVAGSVLLVLSYDPLRRGLSRVTDRIFFQGKYDTEEVLAKLTGVMAREIEIGRLSKELLLILTEEMRITRAAFLVTGEGVEESLRQVGFESEDKAPWIKLRELVGEGPDEVVFDELSEGEVKNQLREMGVSYVSLLKIKDKKIGLMALGPKASGDVYFDQDIELLRLFSPSAAIALNNAKAYREISKFSKTLEKKVEERTEELERTQKEKLAKASELLKLKDEFVFIATHDLATPITAISGYADIIRTRKERMSKDLREDLEEMVAASARLKDLVDDLLQVARSESGTIRVKVTTVNLNEVIEKAVSLLSPKAKEGRIKFEVKLDPKGQEVKGDQEKLFEVFENLFSNAIKYNKPGGSVRVSTKAVGKILQVEVADTGYGIPKEEQEKVFSKFFRSESEEVRGVGGTGLGLFVVRMLVTKMGGKIGFESKEGTGTTFRIELKRG